MTSTLRRPFTSSSWSYRTISFLFLGSTFLYVCSSILSRFSTPISNTHLQILHRNSLISGGKSRPRCDYQIGRWIDDPNRVPLYGEDCPFHRNAWNCIKNGREDMVRINSWRWKPSDCDLPRIDPEAFLNLMRNRRIGFVGDSLNENFLVSFLCILRQADEGARKWKRKGAWRGGYFPQFNVTVAYHRAVLLAKYEWQPSKVSNTSAQKESNGFYRVDVDIPAADWINVAEFYDVLVFNTGHWWGKDKFPDDKPLVFYKKGREIVPHLSIRDGLREVLKNMIPYIETRFPWKVLKLWRTQSPRHFYGGEWNQNGSCLFKSPLEDNKIEAWFGPGNNGVNGEAREVNSIIKQSLLGSDIGLFNLTHLSEFRADAHPAVWLGRKDAVAIWGQDCMHWCLPGLPDTWVDILAAMIRDNFERNE